MDGRFTSRKGWKRSVAFDFVRDACRDGNDECVIYSFPQKRLSIAGKTKTPQWIACQSANGSPPPGAVPVRECGVPGCVNGNHFKWGTMEESLAARVFRDRSGARNPNASLNWDAVRAIRAIKWGLGFSSALRMPYKEYLEAEQSRVATEYGITAGTLRKVLAGYVWKETSPTDGDEF